MAAPINRLPHLGVLAANAEIMAYAEVTKQYACQLTTNAWWNLPPIDFVGVRFVYDYGEVKKLLDEHGYPRRLHPDVPRRPRTPNGYEQPPRVNMRIFAGVKEIASIAQVPTSRAAQMTMEHWFWPVAVDHLAGGTVYRYPDVLKCLTKRGYPRVHKTIGERMEATAA
jgi:hypothetical protein